MIRQVFPIGFAPRSGRPMPPHIRMAIGVSLALHAGVLAYLVVHHATGSTVLAGLAFSIGFVALLLARSELFTENFLVPVAAVAARHGTLGGLARLGELAGQRERGADHDRVVVAATTTVRAAVVDTGGEGQGHRSGQRRGSQAAANVHSGHASSSVGPQSIAAPPVL